MSIPPPLPVPNDLRRKLLKEMCIFFIGLGLLLAIGAYFTLQGISGPPPPLWGYPRHLAIGVPLAILSAFHLVSGALLAILRNQAFCITGAIASTLLSVFFFFFIFSATGAIHVNLISIVMAALPFVVWKRAASFLSAG